jgi:hypothetical protein
MIIKPWRLNTKKSIKRNKKGCVTVAYLLATMSSPPTAALLAGGVDFKVRRGEGTDQVRVLRLRLKRRQIKI